MNSDRLERLNEFLRERPDDPFLLYARLLEYIRKGLGEDAERAIENLLSQHPDYLGTYYTSGVYFERQGNPDRALAIYRQGITLAKRLGDLKTAGEIQAATDLLEC